MQITAIAVFVKNKKVLFEKRRKEAKRQGELGVWMW